jgi:hypothetical protein
MSGWVVLSPVSEKFRIVSRPGAIVTGPGSGQRRLALLSNGKLPTTDPIFRGLEGALRDRIGPAAIPRFAKASFTEPIDSLLIRELVFVADLVVAAVAD